MYVCMHICMLRVCVLHVYSVYMYMYVCVHNVHATGYWWMYCGSVSIVVPTMRLTPNWN